MLKGKLGTRRRRTASWSEAIAAVQRITRPSHCRVFETVDALAAGDTHRTHRRITNRCPQRLSLGSSHGMTDARIGGWASHRQPDSGRRATPSAPRKSALRSISSAPRPEDVICVAAPPMGDSFPDHPPVRSTSVGHTAAPDDRPSEVRLDEAQQVDTSPPPVLIRPVPPFVALRQSGIRRSFAPPSPHRTPPAACRTRP